MSRTPRTSEQYSSHIPALKTLMLLEWEYMPASQCLRMRGSNREVLLRDILVFVLKQRRFTFKGKEYPLSDNGIDQIVREVTSLGLNEGLLTANERFYTMLTMGITVTEFIDGVKVQPTIPIVNWEDPSKNSFIVTDEMEVLSAQGTHTRRPDIVLFLNGIPVVVIEAKRPDAKGVDKPMVMEGVSQQIRNQKPDEIPSLFSYAQLLLSISVTDAKYGTVHTPAKFWSSWREERTEETVNWGETWHPELRPDEQKLLLSEKSKRVQSYFKIAWSGTRGSKSRTADRKWLEAQNQRDCIRGKEHMRLNEQEVLLTSLLIPHRFLEFIRYFIIFDKKVGKIAARYQQFFGIKALIERVSTKNRKGAREGGVIWHTTGSGKSFTMVFLCKAMLLHPNLKECRIIVVTDRIDLETQLAKTFLSGGAFGSIIASRKDGERAKVKTGKDLAKRIGKGSERILFSIINKFNTASKQPECYNDSEDLIVLIDEGHRSHGGENHERMRTALPNAAFVAFTGTPLLKDDKTTNKFGPIVHAYTMKRAVEDGTVTPLLYEDRKPELDVNAKAIDNWFEKITAGLTEEQKADLKKKFSQKGRIYASASRIELIAWDIAVHFDKNFKSLGLGLKGQLATENKQSAIRYKKALDQTGMVTSAVVISPPDTREGHTAVDETKIPEVQQWWKDNIGNDSEEYEREVIKAFATDGEPDILIVVDKFLTGFDEPKNAVLYIDKPLKEHNLVQAIARVNRLHEQKQYGLLIDYRGILKELDTTIKSYQDMADRTQGGYDVDDIEGLYSQVSTEYKRLPTLHDRLWTIFSGVKDRQDLEQYRQVLMPKAKTGKDGHIINPDTRAKIRDDFYEALTEFGMCLKTALSSRHFFEDSSFPETIIAEYKSDLKFFSSLRTIAKQDAQETVDFSAYEEQIRRLVDQHVIGESIQEPEGVIILDESADDPEEWSKEKTRNETDIIKTRVKKTIEVDLADDPYAQKVFSELLREAIAQAEALFKHPNKQFVLFKEFEENVNTRKVEGVPDAFGDNQQAKAYYGTFRIVLGDDHFEAIDETEQNQFIEEAKAVDEVVKQAVSEHSLNPQNIEAEIRKGLLPRLFKRVGLDTAKEVIEKVIQITRIGINRGEL
ncbi:MAG: type I restriction endonuclease subunit R [Magnetococcales bacterium]|nr:type I restriction endonuclease subunit R [Magnetococcales bacterium]